MRSKSHQLLKKQKVNVYIHFQAIGLAFWGMLKGAWLLLLQ